MAMILTLTTAGRAALINSSQTGTEARVVASCGVTATAFVANENMTELPDESKRITSVGGIVANPDLIAVSVRDTTQDVYTVRGIGLYLDDGTLLAVYGQDTPVIEKSKIAVMILQLELMILDAAINASSITFGDLNFVNPPATEKTEGIVRLASPDELREGELDNKAVIPVATFAQAAADSLAGSGLEVKNNRLAVVVPVKEERFKMIYPNGGTEAAPATIVSNNRYVIDNPFTNKFIECRAELFIDGQWGAAKSTGVGYASGAMYSYGAIATQVDGSIILQTGWHGLVNASRQQCNGFGGTQTVATAPARIIVWMID